MQFGALRLPGRATGQPESMQGRLTDSLALFSPSLLPLISSLPSTHLSSPPLFYPFPSSSLCLLWAGTICTKPRTTFEHQGHNRKLLLQSSLCLTAFLGVGDVEAEWGAENQFAEIQSSPQGLPGSSAHNTHLPFMLSSRRLKPHHSSVHRGCTS